MAEERINIIVQEKGTRVVKRRIAEVGGVAKTAATGVRSLQTALLGLGAGLALRSTIRTIASFEQAMSTVRAVSQATNSDFIRLRDTARDLGATTRFTATQAAEGMVELSRAGFKANETMVAVGDTLLLAQAGSLDLQRAAELTAGAIRGYGLAADQAGRVTDVLAYAANNSATDVNQLGEALKFVAPAAHGLNVSLEESVGALEVLADNMLKGSLGGTGLRQVMIELESPSSKTRKIFQQVGVSADQVRVSSVGLTKALGTLAEAGLNTGQAYEIFGRRGGGAANILINSVPKIKEATRGVEEAGGTAKEVARIMDDNLNGSLLRVKSAFEAVQLSLGESGWSDRLQSILDGLANGLRYLAEHIEIVQGAVYALAFAALPSLIAALTALAPLLALAAVGAGIGALVSYRNEIKLTEEGVATLGDLISAVWERIITTGQLVVDFFKNQFGGITSAFDDIEFSVADMVMLTARGLDAWIGLWRGAMNAIVAIFKNLGPALKEIMIDAMNEVFAVLDSGFRRFYQQLGKIPGRVGEPYRRLARDGVIPRLEQTAEGATEQLANAVIDGFAKGFDEITIFEDSVNGLFDRAEEIGKERLAKAQEQAAAAGQTTPQGTGVAPAPEDGPAARLSQLQSGIQAGLESIQQTIHGFGAQAEATLVNAFNSAEDALVEFVTTGKVNFKSLVDSILADLTRLLARQAISGLLNSLGGGGGGFFGSLASAFGGGKADGGSVVPGQFYVVGEKGPELFAPNSSGRIVPNDAAQNMAAGAQAAPAVPNITIINVSSKEEALAALESAEGERIVVNYMDQRERQVQ